MVVACVAVVFAQDKSTSSTPKSRPASLVAAIDDRLAVLGSADGRASYIPGRFPDVSSIAATPDGRSIMLGPKDCRTNWIQRVDISTGTVEEFVGAAEFPVVNGKSVVLVSGIPSPDARALVAYGIRCDGKGMLGFTDILTGQNARRPALGEAGYTSSLPIEIVHPLAWLTDGLTLFYEISVRGEAHPRYYFGRVWPLVTPAEEVVRRIAATVPESGAPTAAALIDDTTVAFAQGDGTGSRVREWDVKTERFVQGRRNFRLPETIVALTADASGMHFLAVTRSRALYRWSVGDTAPMKLADRISAAAWLSGN